MTKGSNKHKILLEEQNEILKRDLDMEVGVTYSGLGTSEWNDLPVDKWKATVKNLESGKIFTLDYHTGLGHRDYTRHRRLGGVPRKLRDGNRYAMDELDLRSYKAYGRITLHMAEKKIEGVPVAPLPFAILACIRSEMTGGEPFETWCYYFEYDPDSRKALATYLELQEQEAAFRTVFPYVALEEYEPIRDY